MNKSESNVVVLGRGLAGVSAALRASELGSTVTLVGSRDGATTLSSGALDICRDPLGIPGDILGWEKNWQKNIKTLLELNPNHPYRLTSFAKIRESIQALVKSLESVDFRLKVSGENNLLLSTPVGTWKETSGAQSTQVGFDLFKNKEEHIVIVKVKNHTNFSPSLIKERFKEYIFKKASSKTAISVSEIDLGLPINASDMAIAEMIEQKDVREKLTNGLRKIAEKEQPSLFLMPPILGLDASYSVLESITKEIRIPMVETLGYYESIPGIRIQRAMMNLLERKGIRVINGDVVNFSSKNSKIENLIIKDNKEEMALNVGEVILATGKWIGGGIRQQNDLPIKETIFDLPLRVEKELIHGTKPNKGFL